MKKSTRYLGLDVHADTLIDADFDVGKGDGFEARHLGSDGVVPGWKRGGDVFAVAVGGDDARQAGAFIDDRDFGVGDDRAA